MLSKNIQDFSPSIGFRVYSCGNKESGEEVSMVIDVTFHWRRCFDGCFSSNFKTLGISLLLDVHAQPHAELHMYHCHTSPLLKMGNMNRV